MTLGPAEPHLIQRHTRDRLALALIATCGAGLVALAWSVDWRLGLATVLLFGLVTGIALAYDR